MNSILFYAIIILAVGAVVGFGLATFIKYPSSKKLEVVQNWLLYAVAAAEEELGAGTGKLKLAQVYNEFATTFTDIASTLPYDTFCTMVDLALAEFKNLLKNDKIASLIEGTTEEKTETAEEKKQA